MEQTDSLKRTLTPVLLWGLGVGYVIGGMYFGWNLGLKEGGTLGMAVATFFIIIMYVCFSFSYSELACAIPKAGGAFDYAERAMGKNMGFIAGIAQIIEFVFAPPAVAISLGAYINLIVPGLSALNAALILYIIFTIINILGVKTAAIFELVITIFAVSQLLLFAGITLPHFKTENLIENNLPNGWSGAFASIPFAIWFFLAIEGVANMAEETVNPQRDISKGFGSAIITLVILCIITFIASVGLTGWQGVVYNANGETSDSPLMLAMSSISTPGSMLFKLFAVAGFIGLLASFHGIMIASARATFEFGRVGNAPKILGKINHKFKTPSNALIANSIIGMIALLTGRMAEIIVISVFGALTLYIVSMIAVIELRRKEPAMNRPFKVPLYPLLPALALIIAIISTVAMIVYNTQLAIIYFGFLIIAFIIFKMAKNNKRNIMNHAFE